MQDYKEIISAMHVLGLSEEQMENIHFVLSSILQLGNINFISTGGAQVNDSNGEKSEIIKSELKHSVLCVLSAYLTQDEV